MNPKQIYGLIGFPVAHSLSKKMQEAAFAACGINAEYRLIPVEPEKLADFLTKNMPVSDAGGKKICLKELSGFNITIPHKVRAREMLEKNFPAAGAAVSALDSYYLKLTGAVNTVKKEGDTLCCWNTDAGGFLRALFEDLKFKETKGRSVLLLGCGGAGRAVVAALSWRDLDVGRVYIYEKNPEAIKSTQEYFSRLPPEWVDLLKQKTAFIAKEEIPQALTRCSLLINASPVGMENDEGSVIDRGLLRKNKQLSVYDVVYNRTTRLIRDAQGLGLPASGGLGMLLFQGVYAFRYWIGIWPDVNIMRRALEKGMEGLCSQQ
jgi:shikimate dehydrogenase